LIDDGNNAFAGLLGMASEAFIGKNFIQLLASLNPEVAKRLTEAAEGAVIGKATVIDAVPVSGGNNRFFDLAITPLSDDNNRPYCILLSATEVTEAVTLKQQAEHAEDNLEESALLMRQAQEMANFGNWRWDVLQNKVTWSDALYQIYGLDKHTFKSTFEGYQELLHPQDRQRVIEGITATLYSGNDVVFEERIIRPDGSVRHLRSWGRVQKADNGQPIRMVGACLDITESKAAEALLTDERQKHEEIPNYNTGTCCNWPGYNRMLFAPL
jgi:PAS domain S-box-containing protein